MNDDSARCGCRCDVWCVVCTMVRGDGAHESMPGWQSTFIESRLRRCWGGNEPRRSQLGRVEHIAPIIISQSRLTSIACVERKRGSRPCPMSMLTEIKPAMGWSALVWPAIVIRARPSTHAGGWLSTRWLWCVTTLCARLSIQSRTSLKCPLNYDHLNEAEFQS